MRKPKTYSIPELFSSTILGLTFEFYSSKATEFIIEELSNVTMKNIVITNDYNHEPSYTRAVLIKEYEGEKPRYSFKMAQQRYDSIVPILKEVLSWISETSQCTQDTLLRVNMTFDHKHLQTLHTISKMNPQKLILKINEDYIYQRFPLQEDSPYAFSVKHISPMSETTYTQDLLKNVNYIIGIPQESYYGINFKDQTRGILEYNYIGGESYAEKQNEILEIIQYYVLTTYQSLNEIEYNKEEIRTLKKLTEEFNKIQEVYYDPSLFSTLYPEVKVMVDLRMDEQLIKTYWHKIRNQLFETVINQKMSKGTFNYDSDHAVFQLKNASLNCSKLKNFDLVQCDVRGILENCNFVSCEINEARVYNSKIVYNSEVNDSYLKQVTIDQKNVVERCFIENNRELLNCDITNSIIKFAGIGKNARLDESTVVIDKQHDYKPVIGIEIEEIRDYNFIKDMAKSNKDHVFGNEYKRKTYL